MGGFKFLSNKLLGNYRNQAHLQCCKVLKRILWRNSDYIPNRIPRNNRYACFRSFNFSKNMRKIHFLPVLACRMFLTVLWNGNVKVLNGKNSFWLWNLLSLDINSGLGLIVCGYYFIYRFKQLRFNICITVCQWLSGWLYFHLLIFSILHFPPAKQQEIPVS